MSPEAYTAEAVQQAIAQGAITEAYQADPQQVIQALNRLRATEVTSYLQYNLTMSHSTSGPRDPAKPFCCRYQVVSLQS